MTIKAFIIDDETPARSELRYLLEQIEGIHVVGEASNGTLGLKGIKEAKPHVVFLDIQMPGVNGLELSDDMKEVLQYGFDIVDDTFVLLGTTCMIRLDPMLKVAQSMIIETQSVEDLLIKIGLGHISDEQLKELVSAVLPINRKAGYIDLYFQKDRPGQSAVVTAVMRKLDISATRILAEALGEDSYAKFTICFDPSDMPRIEEVVETLANDPICKNLGLIPASIRIHKNTSRKK